jgi:hypothetical protein
MALSGEGEAGSPQKTHRTQERWLQERDSNARSQGMNLIRGLITAPSSCIEDANAHARFATDAKPRAA